MKVNLKILICLILSLIVFIFFGHTLNYPWKHFDEQIIYNETIFPAALSFGQIFEYLKCFGLNNHFEASSPFYSSISNLRGDPMGALSALFVHSLFQKNAFLFHLLSLVLHMINTCLLFLVIDKISLSFLEDNSYKRLFIVSILSLVWALHPVNVESILFTANWAAVLSYTFCIFVIYYFINFNLKENSIKNALIVFILFLIPVFMTEYSCTVPLILFLYTYAHLQHTNKTQAIIKNLNISIKKCIPLFIPFIFFIIHFFSSLTNKNLIPDSGNSTIIGLERIFWLSPQIFFHFVKLVFFPISLSIDQTAMVKLSKSLFEPYSIFCTLFMYSILLISMLSFIFIRKSVFYFLFILLFPFMVSISPFLHIASPAYCLASERYLYLPTLIFILGFSHLIFFLLSKNINKKIYYSIIFFLSVVLVLFSLKTLSRTFDWKDSESLFTSSLKSTKSDLFKGLRTALLGSLYSNTDMNKGTVYIKNAVVILEKSIEQLEETKKYNESKTPDVIKTYGLDEKTIQAKTAYLLVSTRLGLDLDLKDAYEILKPYMEDKSIIDTQILDLYMGILFANNQLDKAEELLNFAIKKKTNPTILIILSEIYKRKYNDLARAEELLKKSFKLFPYDPQTLDSLRKFYLYANKPVEFATFSYLHGIRMHSKESLENAYNVFIRLNNAEMANKALENINLINLKTL